MKELLWAERQKLRRSKIIWITVFATIMVAVIVFAQGQVHGNAFCKNGTEKNSGKAGGIITTFARFLSYKVKGKRFPLAYSTLTKNGRSVHISIQAFICCGERHIAQTPRPPADGQSVRQQDNIKGAERYLVADSQPVVGCKAP